MDTHPVFIVTGLSGAGKSLALKALEDFGCEVIDNFPVTLCRALLRQKPLSRPLALGIDVRTRDFKAETLLHELASLRDAHKIVTLFLEASPENIRKRYRETRRSHPLGAKGDLDAWILEEKNLLMHVRAASDFVVDTSTLTPPDMRRHLQRMLSLQHNAFLVSVLSFAYRNGVPAQADMMFDMRFLVNPHYQEDMRALTGKALLIRSFLGAHPLFQKFIHHVDALLTEVVLPQLREEGRGEVVIAFGCTGGRHRSVCTAEFVAELLRSHKYVVALSHREL